MSILARFWEPWHFAIPAARCPSLKEKLLGRTRLGPPRNVISGDQSLISPGSQKKFFDAVSFSVGHWLDSRVIVNSGTLLTAERRASVRQHKYCMHSIKKIGACRKRKKKKLVSR